MPHGPMISPDAGQSCAVVLLFVVGNKFHSPAVIVISSPALKVTPFSSRYSASPFTGFAVTSVFPLIVVVCDDVKVFMPPVITSQAVAVNKVRIINVAASSFFMSRLVPGLVPFQLKVITPG